jgi:hypothetical protein
MRQIDLFRFALIPSRDSTARAISSRSLGGNRWVAPAARSSSLVMLLA